MRLWPYIARKVSVGSQNWQFNDTQSRSSPPPYTSPTPSDEPATSGTLPAPAIKSEPKSDGHSSTGDAIRGVANTQYGSPSSGSSSHDLASQLAEAKATITRLQEQVKQHQQGLRERKTAAVASDSKSHTAEGATGMGLTTHPPEGVSVQICAALCLVTFLLAYLFFWLRCYLWLVQKPHSLKRFHLFTSQWGVTCGIFGFVLMVIFPLFLPVFFFFFPISLYSTRSTKASHPIYASSPRLWY